MEGFLYGIGGGHAVNGENYTSVFFVVDLSLPLWFRRRPLYFLQSIPLLAKHGICFFVSVVALLEWWVAVYPSRLQHMLFWWDTHRGCVLNYRDAWLVCDWRMSVVVTVNKTACLRQAEDTPIFLELAGGRSSMV